MKKIRKNTLFIALAINLLVFYTACDKWVTYNPHDEFKITDLDYFTSESDYRTAAVSVYTCLQWLNQIVVIGEIAADNAVAGGESASDVVDLQQIDDHTLTGSDNNNTLTDIWQSAYEGINRANYLIQYKTTNPAGKSIDFAGKEALYGEIYFLRAFFYFSLVKLWGDVPLFSDKRLALESSGKLSRSPKEEVYALIESDLKQAISVLPITNIQPGRATKFSAQALLGKVYLYEKKYDDAKTVLESVINANRFSLVANFGDIFLSAGENGSESVFEIQYSNLFPYYNWNGGQTKGQGNYAVQQCGVRNLFGSDAMPFAPGWSTNLPTQNLADAFDAADERKAATIFDVEAYKNNNPALVVTYQVAPYKNTGLYNMKFLPRIGQTSGQPELNYTNNFRTIRYSDVLLMAAEAFTKSTAPDFSKAQNYLNQVRRRAFNDVNHDISLTGDALFDAIINERRLEFAMEGERFFDLVRTGKAATVLATLKRTLSHNGSFTAYKSPTNDLFPIPLREIQVSGLTQNSGY